jgi:type IV pilus assembly protein PilO
MATFPSLNLQRFPNLTKYVVGFFLVALVGFAYYVVLYGDVADAIARAKKQQQSLEADLATTKQSQFEYQRDLAELAQRQQKQRELNTVLPETTQYPAFLSALQGVANVAGVTLQGWTPQDEVVQKFFAKVPMRLSLVGKYHQVAKFFYGVGQLDRIINIENISLTQPKTTAGEVELKVDCLATAFHTLPQKGSSPASQEKPK